MQYMEDSFPIHILTGSGGPSSSRLPAKERSTLPQESPIRSLCGDRLHVARGIVINSPIAEDQPTLEAPTRVQPPRGRKPSAPKLTGKRQVPEKPPVKNRGPGNPLQGVSLKKRCVCKNQISPRRKTTSTGTNRGPTAPATSTRVGTQQQANPPINLIPAMTRQGTDFWSRLNTLPQP